MRRIDEEQPKQSVWEKEVDVRISVKELAILTAITGDSSNDQINASLDELVGTDRFAIFFGTIGEDYVDIPLQLYQELKEILRQEGAIE